MSIYTTPLQFGYFLGLSMAVLFCYRGWKEERLSDKLLAVVMFLLAMEIQDYTFGFAGINYLWNELNGFPRGTALLFGPAIYFYLRSQVNRDFRWQKIHLWHLAPWALFFLVEFAIFLQGPERVSQWQNSQLHQYMSLPRLLILWASYAFYFYHSVKLYQDYRRWALDQFSNQSIVSFIWFRNFVYIMIIGIVFKECFSIVDSILELDFYQDWWWNLLMVGIIFYVGIFGFAQDQPSQIHFTPIPSQEVRNVEIDKEHQNWKRKIDEHMTNRMPYLDPTLSLNSMAQQLNTNPSILSALINQIYDQNFNDFINGYRIDSFKSHATDARYQNYTLLALGLESGFNSKSTFNRSCKKLTGLTPAQLLDQQKKQSTVDRA